MVGRWAARHPFAWPARGRRALDGPEPVASRRLADQSSRSGAGREASPHGRSPPHLLFNGGYATSSGPDLARTDLSGEAIRLARGVHDALPDDPEVAGLLALMLLTDARRPARTCVAGELVALAQQDRNLWDRRLITEGLSLLTRALPLGRVGEYHLQAPSPPSTTRRPSTPTPTGPTSCPSTASSSG